MRNPLWRQALLAPVFAAGIIAASPEGLAAEPGLGVSRSEVQRLYTQSGFRFGKPDIECPSGFHRDWNNSDSAACIDSDGTNRVSGQPRVIGRTSLGDTSVEVYLVGPPDDLSKATLQMVFLPGERAAWAANALHASALLRTFGWPEPVEWVTENLQRALSGQDISTRRDDILVSLNGTAVLPGAPPTIFFLSVEAVESEAARRERELQAKREREQAEIVTARQALADGDALSQRGELVAAIEAWNQAVQVSATQEEARVRQLAAWRKIAGQRAELSDFTGAVQAFESARAVLPREHRTDFENGTFDLQVQMVEGLLVERPLDALAFVELSQVILERRPDLYRDVLITTARMGCSVDALDWYSSAHQVQSLKGDTAIEAAICAVDRMAAAVDGGSLDLARAHYEKAEAWAPNVQEVKRAGAGLRRAEARKEKEARSSETSHARSETLTKAGLIGTFGGGALLGGSCLMQLAATSTAEELQGAEHLRDEVERLVAQGQFQQGTARVLAGSGLAVGSIGLVLLAKQSGGTTSGLRMGATPSGLILELTW